MTALVSMKLSAAEKKEWSEGPSLASEYAGPDYPYGLRIDLDTAQMEKLGIKALDINQELTLTAKVVVQRYTETKDGRNGERRSCELQVTDMALEFPSSSNAATVLWGDK